MKTVLKNTKRILAVMLALALVVLAVPDTALLAADFNTDPAVVESTEAPTDSTEEDAAEPAATEPETEATVPAADPVEPAADPVDPEEVTVDNAATGEDVNVDNVALGVASTRRISCTGSNWDQEWTSGYSGSGYWVLDADISLKAVPATGYGVALNASTADPEITVKSGAETLDATVAPASTFDEDGAYTISVDASDIDEASGDITINVKTEKQKFTVTTDPAVVATTGKSGDIQFGTLENTGSTDTPNWVMKKAVYGTAYTFTAKLTQEAKNAGKEITDVAYVAGSGEKHPAISSSGSYTIPAAEVTDDISITVTTGLRKLNVNISGTGYLGGATIGGEPAATTPYGEELVITFPPSSIKDGYEMTGAKVYTTSAKTASVQIADSYVTFDPTEGTVTVDPSKVKNNLWVVVSTGYKKVEVNGLVGVTNCEVTTVSGLDPVYETPGDPESEIVGYTATYNKDAKFKAVAADDHVITGVTYSVGGADPIEITASSGVYTISKNAFTNDVAVSIQVEEDTAVALPVAISPDAFTDLYVEDVKWKESTKTTYAALEGGTATGEVTPGTKVDIKVTTDSAVTGTLSVVLDPGDTAVPVEVFAGPTKVKNKDQYETVYRVPVTSETASLGLGITGTAAFTYKVALKDNSNAIKGGMVDILQDGTKVASLANNGTVNVVGGTPVVLAYNLVNGNFAKDSIKIGSTEAADEAVAGYDVAVELTDDPIAGANITVTNKILTKEVDIENKTKGISQVKFAADNTQTKPSASYAAGANNGKKWVTGSGNTYLVYGLATEAVLSLKAATGYIPVAKVGGVTLDLGDPSSAGVYTYKFTSSSATTLAQLLTAESVVITETEDTEILTIVDYDGCLAIPSVTVDGVEQEDIGGGKYEIRKGATASVKIVPNENCKLTKATKKVGSAAATNLSCSATALTTSIKMDKDPQTITVYSEPLFALEPLEDEDGKQYNGGSNFTYKNLPYDTTIIWDARYGEASVKDSVDIDLAATDKKDLDDATTMTGGVLNISRKDAGRTIKATVTYEDGDKEFTKTYTMTSVKALTKIGVAGVDATKGTFTQMVGTTKTYAITSKSAGATLDGLDFTDIDDADLKATLSEDHKTLTVTVLDSSADRTVFTMTDGGEELDGGEFELRTIDPAIVKTTGLPTVSQTGASDVSLNLKLGLPRDVANMYGSRVGSIFYIINVTDVEQLGSNPVSAAVDPIYVEATGTSQTAVVKVLDEATGAGGAAKVDFRVSLGQSYVEGDPGEIADIVSDPEKGTYDTTNVKNANFQTKEPAYTQKLTLQKKTNVLYTGDTYKDSSMKKLLNADGDLVLAVVKADSFATVSSYTASSITFKDAEDADITITPEVNNAGELVIRKADLATLAGKAVVDPVAYGGTAIKRTIYVHSNPRANDEHAGANFELTITPRAYTADLTVSPAASTLYHKAGTALTATLKAETDASVAKNNAYVWWIDEVDDSGAAVAAGVTVKDGKVTIPKGYMDTVKVFAGSKYSTNGAANPTYAISASATITQKATAVDASAVVYGYMDKVSDPDNLIVVAENNTSITVNELYDPVPDELDGAEYGFYVVKKGAIATTVKVGDVTRKQYALDDIVTGETVVTYESGNTKNLTLAGNSVDEIYKVGSVPVTATLQDSGAKVKMNVKIENKKLDTAASTTYKEYATIIGEKGGEDAFASNAELLDGEVFSEDLYNKKMKSTTATLEIEGDVTALGETAFLEIGKVTANEDEDDFAVYGLDDVYGLTMTAVSGAKIYKGNNVLDPGSVDTVAQQQLSGMYTLIVEAPVFKVKVGNTTYTVTDTSMDGVEQQDTKSTMSTLTYGAVVQDYELVKTRTTDKSKSYNTLVRSVVFTPSQTTNKGWDGVLADALNTAFTGAGCDVEASTGKLVVKQREEASPFDAEYGFVPVGTYNLFVTYYDSEGAAITKAQPVSVKIANAPAYKMDASYTTTYAYDGDYTMEPVLLTGKTDPSTYGGAIAGVHLENINTKGAYNNFAEIFGVEETEDGWQIVLNGDLGEATAADLTGNVVFVVNGVAVQRQKVTLNLMTDPGSFAMITDAWVTAHNTGWNNKNTTLNSIVTEMKKDMIVPSNLTIASSGVGEIETYTGSTITVVAGTKYKTYDAYISADEYPTFFCQKPTGTTKTTDPAEGHLYGVMKITTSKPVNGYLAKAAEYTDFHMEMDPLP